MANAIQTRINELVDKYDKEGLMALAVEMKLGAYSTFKSSYRKIDIARKIVEAIDNGAEMPENEKPESNDEMVVELNLEDETPQVEIKTCDVNQEFVEEQLNEAVDPVAPAQKASHRPSACETCTASYGSKVCTSCVVYDPSLK